MTALKQWKLICPKKKEAGAKINVLDLVFSTGGGNVETLNNYLRLGLHPAWIIAGVTVDTGDGDKDGNPIHDAKVQGPARPAAFLCILVHKTAQRRRAELPPKVVQERLGHGTIAMTMDVYGHLFPRGDNAEKIDEAERAFLA